jgi:hypothetical protein
MVCGVVTTLSCYSFLVTVILIIISILYSQTGPSIIDTCKNEVENQEIKSESQSHIDFLNVDISGNDQDCTCAECSTLQYLGLELFEIICLSLIGCGILYFGYKLVVHGRNLLLKLREEKAKADEKKFERLKIRFEAKGHKRRDSLIETANDQTADGACAIPEEKKAPANKKSKLSYEKDDC